MRLLINNYSSNMSTEAHYFANSIKAVGGECDLWLNRNISTYDMFDSYRPDVFLCHYSQVDNDIIKYLSQHKSVQLVMNVTGATQEVIANIESMIDGTGISCKFIFSNVPNNVSTLLGRDISLINIMCGLDLFQRLQQSVLFSIGSAVLSTQKVESFAPILESLDTYHLLTPGDADGYDIRIDIPSLISVFDKYDELVLVDTLPIVTSQLFFEASFRAKKIRVELNDKDQPKFDKFLSTIFNHSGPVDDVADVIKKQILNNHNCYHRTARLVKHMGDESLSDTLTKKGNNL